jgi:hypothetical protein
MTGKKLPTNSRKYAIISASTTIHPLNERRLANWKEIVPNISPQESRIN